MSLPAGRGDGGSPCRAAGRPARPATVPARRCSPQRDRSWARSREHACSTCTPARVRSAWRRCPVARRGAAGRGGSTCGPGDPRQYRRGRAARRAPGQRPRGANARARPARRRRALRRRVRRSSLRPGDDDVTASWRRSGPGAGSRPGRSLSSNVPPGRGLCAGRRGSRRAGHAGTARPCSGTVTPPGSAGLGEEPPRRSAPGPLRPQSRRRQAPDRSRTSERGGSACVVSSAPVPLTP